MNSTTATAPAFLNVAEAAEVSRKHQVTVRLALEGGQLHGYQSKKGGRWSIERECLMAFVRNEPCEHKRSSAKPVRLHAA